MTSVFAALDTSDLQKADQLASQLAGHVYGLKLGLEFFLAQGRAGYECLAQHELPLFLDLKLHDIPNTVAGAIHSLGPLKPAFLTLHCQGGSAMMEAAANAAMKLSGARPKLLGVTVLTSLDGADLKKMGQDEDVAAQVLRFAKLAKKAGLDGIVCSPEEVKRLRDELGPDFVLMVPGIRPSWAASQDQKRVMTPQDAKRAGASFLVIGRPITGDANPAAAAERIQAELAA